MQRSQQSTHGAAETARHRATYVPRRGLGAERPLRLLQVNTHDIGGGAAKVAWDLFTAYRARGYGSWLVVGYKRSSDPDVLVLPNNRLQGRWSRFWLGVSSSLERSKNRRLSAPLLNRLASRLVEPGRSFDFCLGMEDFRYPGTRRVLSLLRQQPDIVHGHNLHGYYFDLRALPWLSQRVPVVLTLHDAWLLAGHCAHSLDCDCWKTGCGHCPDPGLYPAIARDATAYNWRRKRNIYTRSRLFLATPSRWLMRKVEQSMLATAVVEARVIPNGVDLSVFHPQARSISRSTLDIPQDAKVLLFAANGIRENMWKDYQTMRDAVAEVARYLPGKALVFQAVGEDSPPEWIGQAEVRFVPYQTDPEVMALYYQAADVYVHAARADTFPSAVLEALACGTPVVATAVGGIPEQVEDNQTGFLVPKGDAGGLASRLRLVLSDDELRQRMGKQAAESARQRFDLRRQVDTYLDWYLELVQEKARGLFREDAGCAV